MDAHHQRIPSYELFLLISFSPERIIVSQNEESKPAVLTAVMERGAVVYKLNGKRVEDRKDNLLLKNLGELLTAHGTKTPVFIIVDVRAPFAEIGKVETALDKAGLTYNRRLFVTGFRDGTMNEIHWDVTPIPIPRN
jgi:hypothetical protein